jgi:hypothetical protein
VVAAAAAAAAKEADVVRLVTGQQRNCIGQHRHIRESGTETPAAIARVPGTYDCQEHTTTTAADCVQCIRRRRRAGRLRQSVRVLYFAQLQGCTPSQQCIGQPPNPCIWRATTAPLRPTHDTLTTTRHTGCAFLIVPEVTRPMAIRPLCSS